METDVQCTATTYRALHAFVRIAVAGVFAATGYYVWHQYKRSIEREADEWISGAAATTDPWQRVERINSKRPELTDEQRIRVENMESAALASALGQRSEEAFAFIEQRRAWYGDELDKYPRNPAERALQTQALSLVWPRISDMVREDRLLLIRMAEVCHLHEARQPFDRQTTIDCVSFGANALQERAALTRLMDRAVVGHALTNTPQEKP